MKKCSLMNCLLLSLLPVAANAVTPSKTLLPDVFEVYVSEDAGVSTKAFNGAKKVVLPTNNEVKEDPGCYVACYSKNAKNAAFKMYENTYIVGQIRVKGNYHDAMCQPTGFDGKDLSTAKEMKTLCEKAFPTMCEKESCWADGKTSTWIEYN
ncbi:MAG: hypothetical protein AB7V32_05200 [Candidatus Berkiella sp.]